MENESPQTAYQPGKGIWSALRARRWWIAAGIGVAFAAAAFVVFGVPPAGSATLRFEPQTDTVSLNPSAFIDSRLFLDATALVGSVEAIVMYDPATLDINCYSTSNCPDVVINGNSFPQNGVVEVNRSLGSIRIVAGSNTGVQGNGVEVAVFKFRPVAVNETGTQVTLSPESSVMTLSDTPQNILSGGGIKSAQYIIQPKAPTCGEIGGFTCGAAECQGTTYSNIDGLGTGEVCCSLPCGQAFWSVENVSHIVQGKDVNITWDTTRNGARQDPLSCAVQYGLTTAFGSKKAGTGSGNGSYSATLSSLQESRYYYQIECTKPAADGGGTFVSGVSSFDLTAVEPPLAISGTAAINVKSTSVDIVWNTNKDAVSYVLYGTEGHPQGTCAVSDPPNCFGYQEIKQSSTLTRTHKVTLTGLDKNTQYYFRVMSQAPAANPKERAYSSELVFRTKTGVLEPNANTILKVQGNRTCSEWLTCTTGIDVASGRSERERVCVDVGLCRELDPDTGACLRLNPDPNAASAYILAYGDAKNSTVDLIRNRSGYFKPTFEWKGTSSLGGVEGTVFGWGHAAGLKQRGEKVFVPNGNFELSEVGVYPWEVFPNGADTDLTLAFSPTNVNKENLVLQANGRVKDCPGCSFRNVGGVMVPLGNGLNPGEEYIVSFDYFVSLRNEEVVPANESLFVRLYQGNAPSFLSSEHEIRLIGTSGSLFDGWQRAFARLKVADDAPGEQSWLAVLFAADPGPDSAYTLRLDNVRIEPVLEVRPNEFIEKGCRIYPGSTAPECDFIEGGGGIRQGWKGFCLERDPKNPDVCLLWWPVDIVKGETNLFVQEDFVGYADRFPLYYCLESSGNQKIGKRLGGGGYNVWANYQKNIYNDCRKEAPYNLDYTFAHCSLAPKAGEWKATGAESEIYEYDIERVHVKAVWNWGNQYKPDFVFTRKKVDNGATEEFNGLTYVYERLTNFRIPRSPFGTVAPIAWRVVLTESKDRAWDYPNSGTEPRNYIYIYLIFDEQGRFDRYFIDGSDATPNDAEGAAYRVIFYLNETCRYIAQTVTPFGENKAWTDRFLTFQWSSQEGNEIGYAYGQDLAPFGAAVPPPGLPEEWEIPLFVEPPNSFGVFGGGDAAQARAGAPYAVAPNEEQYACQPPVGRESEYLIAGRTCSGPTDSASCLQGGDTGTPYCSRNVCINGVPKSPIQPDTQTCWDFIGDGIYDNATSGQNAQCGGGVCLDFAEWDRGDPTIGESDVCLNSYCDQIGGPAGECVECVQDSDCVSAPIIQGECKFAPKAESDIGDQYCVSGSEDRLGQRCESSADCGFSISGSPGKCVGINLTKDQETAIRGGIAKGVERLKFLFAKSYGVWKMQRIADEDRYAYVPVIDSTIPEESCEQKGMEVIPGTNKCGWDIRDEGVCIGGARDGEVCDALSANSCGTGGKCSSFARPPVVKNLYTASDRVEWSQDGTVIKSIQYSRTNYLNGFGTVVLLFNSFVGDNQLPLVRYTVDWGDGTTSNVSNLRIQDKDNPADPHRLVHTYTCLGPGDPNYDGNTKACTFKPRVQIEDNWGWCNGTGSDKYSGDGTRCNSWDEYGGEIVVVPPQGTPPPPPPSPNVSISSASPPSPAQIPNGASAVDVVLTYSVDQDCPTFTVFDNGTPKVSGSRLAGSGQTETISVAAGSHTFRIECTNSNGTGSGTYPATGTYEVLPPPLAPQIQNFAGSPDTGETPLAVTFTADISDTDNKYPVTVTIDYKDGSQTESKQVNAAGTVAFTHTYSATGDYAAELTAVDTDNLSSSSVFNIRAVGNQAPVISSFTADQQSGSPRTFVFTVSVSDPSNPPDYPVSVDFDFDGDGAVDDTKTATISNTTVTTTYTYPTAGIYTASATATDNKGAASPPSTVSVRADWWNTSYRYRRTVAIQNNYAGTLPAFFPAQLTFATADLQGKMLPNGDDIRIVYEDANGNFQEIDRRVIVDLPSGQIYIWFAIQRDIAQSSSDSSYWMYYGNTGAFSPPSNPNNVFQPRRDANTVLLYHFEENGGTAVQDSSGNNINGTARNGVSWAAGRFGWAASFDGVNDYIEAASNSKLENAEGTVEFWVRVEGSNPEQEFVSKDHLGYRDGGHLSVSHASGGPLLDPQVTFRLQTNTPAPANINVFSDDAFNQPGSDLVSGPGAPWIHVAVTWRNSSGGASPLVQMYINGKLQNSKSTADNQGTLLNKETLFLGASSVFYDTSSPDPASTLRDYLKGRIDGLRWSNVMRTSFPYARIPKGNDPSALPGSEEDRDNIIARGSGAVAGEKVGRRGWKLNPVADFIESVRHIRSILFESRYGL